MPNAPDRPRLPTPDGLLPLATSTQSDHRLLVIDDNHDQRSTLAIALRGLGWEVEEARDGTTGLSLARLYPPSIVITELVLPDMPGFRLARALRTVVEPALLVIALTRLDDTGIHSLARMAGVGDVYLKPANPVELHDRMVAVLSALTAAVAAP
jgi:DNA-binding response OmpR family regulator